MCKLILQPTFVDKIGIVAKNGTGKTTLLNIIAGVDTPDSGTVTYRGDLKVCYLTQLPELTPGASIIEACLEGGGAVAETVARYERAVAEGDADQISLAVHDMDAAGAWDYEVEHLHCLNVGGIDAVDVVGRYSVDDV